MISDHFFFVSQMKKKPSLKNPYKTLLGKEMGNKNKATIHENLHLFDYIYSSATL